jgi:hypothetical protein
VSELREEHRAVRRAAAIALACALGLACGCRAPDFTERRALEDPAMTFQDDPTRVHFRSKVHDAREGAAGEFGSAAGGGCGCY